MKYESVLIIGLGQYGRHLALDFAKRGLSVMVLSSGEEAVNQIAPYVTDAQIGDGTNPAVLKGLGVSDFDVCFVTVGEDFQSSLITTSLLKELGAKYVVSKATDEIQEKFLLRNGADEVVFPERDIAEKTAVRFSSNNILDFIQIGNEYSIFQIPVPVPLDRCDAPGAQHPQEVRRQRPRRRSGGRAYRRDARRGLSVP